MVVRKFISKFLIFTTVLLAGAVVSLYGNGKIATPDGENFIPIDANIASTTDQAGVPEKAPVQMNAPAIDEHQAFLPVIIKTPNIFFVSITGNNADGKSWETAWNELDQIRWAALRPGDIILIDGGEYHSTMSVGKSGLPGEPIVITTNGEQVVLDGQRPTLPDCGVPVAFPDARNDGIDLEGHSYLVIDGLSWRGIVIRRHSTGIMMRENSSNIIVRNVEIYDNGWVTGFGSDTGPDGPGVDLGGSDILFERVIIHDNGQDSFQTGWGVWDFTLRNSWLYNSREHHSIRGQAFNYCVHSDGVQIYDGGVQGPMVIEESIIGPSLTQGIIIDNQADVDNVVIKNTLFVGNVNAGIVITNGGSSSNWTLQNVTVVQSSVNESWNVKMNGINHRIRSSIFWGGPWGIGIFDWSDASGNFNWLTPDDYNVAVEINPIFLDDNFNAFQGEGFADFDFKITNSAIPTKTGSSITSVFQLLYK